MTKDDRDKLIAFNHISGNISRSEYDTMCRISSLIEDDDNIDIDWNELQEACNIIDIQKIEQVLDLMYDLDILSELSYDGCCYG